MKIYNATFYCQKSNKGIVESCILRITLEGLCDKFLWLPVEPKSNIFEEISKPVSKYKFNRKIPEIFSSLGTVSWEVNNFVNIHNAKCVGIDNFRIPENVIKRLTEFLESESKNLESLVECSHLEWYRNKVYKNNYIISFVSEGYKILIYKSLICEDSYSLNYLGTFNDLKLYKSFIETYSITHKFEKDLDISMVKECLEGNFMESIRNIKNAIKF